MAAFEHDHQGGVTETFPTVRDTTEKRDAMPRDTFIQAGKPLRDEGANVCDASPADLNRSAAEGAKYKCISGHREVYWDGHSNCVACWGCGRCFVDLQPLRDQVKQQGSRGNWDQDEYMRGLFNGLECGLATLEGREPKYR